MKHERAPDTLDLRTDAEVIRVSFRVTTPLFGGGVHLGDKDHAHLKEPDAITPVRGATVRGQLRFWWRAAWGCRYPLSEMREREGLIWGRAADQKSGIGPGRVSLSIEGRPTLARERGIGIRGGPEVPDGRQYGAFPLRPRTGDPGWLHTLSGELRLDLRIRPGGREEQALDEDDREGIRRAVLAWLAFGGIGGRTRRGFGAVQQTLYRGQPPLGATLLELGGPDPAQPEAVLRHLQAGLTNAAQVPSLVGATMALRNLNQSSGLDALDEGLNRLRLFRQGSGVARNPGPTPRQPKRSFWPEADAIRRIMRRRSGKHADVLTRTDAFPRAAFGLPIIFHFKDDTLGDPTDTTLKPANAERFASPLIIRPFRNAQGRYDVLALRLGGPGPGPVDLGGTSATGVTTTLTSADLTQDLRKLNTTLGGNPDVLAAFLHFFQR